MELNYNKLYFYQYKIRLQVRSNTLKIPAEPYAFFHGLFGQVLYNGNKHTGTEHQRCNNAACSFCQLFKPVLPKGHFWQGKYATPPSGYVLSPPLNPKPEYKKAEKVEFNLTLIGSANKHLSSIVVAFSKMHHIKDDGTVSNFLFENCEAICPEKQDEAGDNRFTAQNIEPFSIHRHFELKTQTPVYLKANKKLVEKQMLEHVLEQGHVRFCLFEQFYCGEPFAPINKLELKPELKYRQISQKITCWHRDNNEKRIPIRAVHVHLSDFSSELYSYNKLIEFLRYLGVGKYSSYGLGKFSW